MLGVPLVARREPAASAELKLTAPNLMGERLELDEGQHRPLYSDAQLITHDSIARGCAQAALLCLDGRPLASGGDRPNKEERQFEIWLIGLDELAREQTKLGARTSSSRASDKLRRPATWRRFPMIARLLSNCSARARLPARLLVQMADFLA